MTDKEKIIWLLDEMNVQYTIKKNSMYMGGRRLTFNTAGELVSIYDYSERKGYTA
jgi:hypothetical protein